MQVLETERLLVRGFTMDDVDATHLEIYTGSGVWGPKTREQVADGVMMAMLMSQAMIRYAFDELNLRRLVNGTGDENLRSINLHRRLGLSFFGSYWARLFGQAGPPSFSAKVVHFRLTADISGIRLSSIRPWGGNRAIQEKGHLAYQRTAPALAR